jgi:hypothetical protein
MRTGRLFELVAAPEDVETEEFIGWVARRPDRWDRRGWARTRHRAWRAGVAVQVGFAISEERAHSVAVRADNPELLASLDEFIKQPVSRRDLQSPASQVLHQSAQGPRPSRPVEPMP